MYNGFNTYLYLLEVQHLMNAMPTFIVFNVGIPQPSLQPIRIPFLFVFFRFLLSLILKPFNIQAI